MFIRKFKSKHIGKHILANNICCIFNIFILNLNFINNKIVSVSSNIFFETYRVKIHNKVYLTIYLNLSNLKAMCC